MLALINKYLHIHVAIMWAYFKVLFQPLVLTVNLLCPVHHKIIVVWGEGYKMDWAKIEAKLKDIALDADSRKKGSIEADHQPYL